MTQQEIQTLKVGDRFEYCHEKETEGKWIDGIVREIDGSMYTIFWTDMDSEDGHDITDIGVWSRSRLKSNDSDPTKSVKPEGRKTIKRGDIVKAIEDAIMIGVEHGGKDTNKEILIAKDKLIKKIFNQN